MFNNINTKQQEAKKREEEKREEERKREEARKKADEIVDNLVEEKRTSFDSLDITSSEEDLNISKYDNAEDNLKNIGKNVNSLTLEIEEIKQKITKAYEIEFKSIKEIFSKQDTAESKIDSLGDGLNIIQQNNKEIINFLEIKLSKIEEAINKGNTDSRVENKDVRSELDKLIKEVKELEDNISISINNLFNEVIKENKENKEALTEELNSIQTLLKDKTIDYRPIIITAVISSFMTSIIIVSFMLLK